VGIPPWDMTVEVYGLKLNEYPLSNIFHDFLFLNEKFAKTLFYREMEFFVYFVKLGDFYFDVGLIRKNRRS
jgi:hypothetical protein